MSFCLVNYGGDTDLDALLRLAVPQELLEFISCCTIIILQWIISQSFHFARHRQAVRLTQALTNMLMWYQTAWLKCFVQGCLTWQNLCKNRGLQFSTLLFWDLQRKHISLHSHWLRFNFRRNERITLKDISVGAYNMFGIQRSIVMSGQCSFSECLGCKLFKETWSLEK